MKEKILHEWYLWLKARNPNITELWVKQALDCYRNEMNKAEGLERILTPEQIEEKKKEISKFNFGK